MATSSKCTAQFPELFFPGHLSAEQFFPTLLCNFPVFSRFLDFSFYFVAILGRLLFSARSVALSFLSLVFLNSLVNFKQGMSLVIVRFLWFFQGFSGFGRGQRSLVNLRFFLGKTEKPRKGRIVWGGGRAIFEGSASPQKTAPETLGPAVPPPLSLSCTRLIWWHLQLFSATKKKGKIWLPMGSLVAVYCAMRLRFGYGFESCDANGPRNVKNTNLAKHRPIFFSLLVVRSWS